MQYRALKRIVFLFFLFCAGFALPVQSQINTNRVLAIGKNALYFEDYVLSIQYFNQVIRSKPYLAEPYLYRAIAKLSLDDYKGAEDDLTFCIERNPFLFYAYLYRGIARQYQNDYANAIEDYNKGLESRPEDRQMLINKGIAYVQKKDYDSALVAMDRLIKYQPKFTEAYVTRGSIHAEKGDTTQALVDYTKALELNKYYAPTYGQRALLYYQQQKYQDALSDLNEAIRLEPKQIGYYINRGLARYNLNDLRGTMSDFDAVVNLDSRNTVARYNRGLLRAQVGDSQGAIEDFNIAISNEPDNFMAIYNRAILNNETRNYRNAVSDLDRVLEEYPYFVMGYYFRSEIKREMRDAKGADTDYWYAYNMEQTLRKEKEKGKVITGKGVFDPPAPGEEDAIGFEDEKTRERSDQNIEKFNRLVVYDKEEEIKSSYKNEIRGRVQDKHVKVDLMPQFVITYYEKPEVIDQTASRYNKTISDYNAKQALKLKLKAVNEEAALTDQQVDLHFKSIDDYSLAIDRNSDNIDAYFGRAMDFMVLQDLSEAIDDFGKIIKLDPNFILAYFNRAVVRYKQVQIENYDSNDNDANNLTLNIQTKKNIQLPSQSVINTPIKSGMDNTQGGVIDNKRKFDYDQIMRDYATVIELDPNFIYAYFNRGNIRCAQKDFRTALIDYDEAIKRNPDFAEAYFNRGLTRLYIGDTNQGIADLSKAGELGIVDAYSIIKKMTAD
ncbi:MAG: tetratricopeptide repeat protein [Dysgonamonadaceae bacterium]|jgi:tetratricopeptide (TPR) repeat protein|nr:tetratricopeptide repeat protein [Dysgonamonadaceae bacterium]